MTTQQDDFLAQILAAEKTAGQKIAKATEKARLDKGKYEKMLSEKREKVLNAAREKAKGRLQEKQVAVKDVYRDILAEGQKEVSTIKKEAIKKEEKIITSAGSVFLNDIL